MPGRWGTRSRWLMLALAGVATLAMVIVVVRVTTVTACAAVPQERVTKGKATNYTLHDGGGNCSFVGPPGDQLFVALSPTEYAEAGSCGGYLEVTGPRGSVRVKIIDQCPECAPGHLDLSRPAFGRIAALSAGEVPVTYRLLSNPTLPGPLTFKIQSGSSAYWLAIVPDNHGNPLRTVEVRGDRGWRSLTRADHNAWIAEGGAGPGPFTVRLTDRKGNIAEVRGVTLGSARSHQAAVWMYGRGPATSTTTARTTTTPNTTSVSSSAAESSTVPPTSSSVTPPPSTSPVAVAAEC